MRDLGPVVVLNILAGTPETGAWCPHCLLPSVATVPLHLLRNAGVSHIGTWRRCLDCGRTGSTLDT